MPVGAVAPIRIGTDFDEGHATAIQTIQLVDRDGTESWYDLSGRRLNGAPTTKGVYINNGKKLIIR